MSTRAPQNWGWGVKNAPLNRDRSGWNGVCPGDRVTFPQGTVRTSGVVERLDPDRAYVMVLVGIGRHRRSVRVHTSFVALENKG